MNTSPTVKVPRPAAKPGTPTPVDPAQEAHARLATPSTKPPFVQQTRQQVVLLDGEIARLEMQIKELTQQVTDLQAQQQGLATFLAIADARQG